MVFLPILTLSLVEDVLTASTLYNDDYSVAVLDFLVNKIEQEQKQ